ncbi:LysR family transcriptional regulator [Marinomonas spartinae]|uniref:LysR family transcriptional regulator n=1 Tax=Marinomonas spartinae TaxID=1792290 RepID=UPI0018F25077|nr:LysR family transcriptional regulator [Marinomonas spartinae]MBJ7552918.1 LysR family transcriptional regulator [Marinomonas spartinae]
MNKDIGWELYRSFLGVMQEGSLSAAARALGSTQPTIGRHIAELERVLNITLFIRTQGGLTPTDAANALLLPASEMANIAAAMERVTSRHGDDIQGTVRVTTSDVIGIEILPTIFADIAERFPNIHLELALSDKVQDLLSREADIAIRMFRPKQTQLIARRIGNIGVGFFAHTCYLTKHGTPSTLADLEAHRLIGFDRLTDYIRSVAKKLPFPLEKDSFVLRTDSNVAQLALIRAGAGIGLCQIGLAERDKSLVRLLAEDFCFEMDTWVTMHEDLRKSPACKTVFRELVAGLQGYVY